MNARMLSEYAPPFLGLVSLIGGVAALAIVSAPLFESDTPVAAVSASEVFSLTNAERSDEGVTPLKRNGLLDSAAQMKAQDMAANGYYAHVSPSGVTPMHWVEKAGYKYLIIGENLVVNRTDAEQVVDAFMGSPGHKANILRKDFTEIGVGVANGVYKGKDATFAVQIFASPYPGSGTVAAKSSSENVKQVSTETKVTKPVASKKVETPVKVPQPAVSPAPTKVAETATQATSLANSLQEKVKTLIKPLTPPSTESTSTATSAPATSTFAIPSFVLNDRAPIELVGVSQLEAQTLPVPLGSTWTMEFRYFVENVLLGARGLFVR